MIEEFIVCDKCKEKKPHTYKDAVDLVVLIDRKHHEMPERIDFEKDLCESCYEKFIEHIRAFFKEGCDK